MIHREPRLCNVSTRRKNWGVKQPLTTPLKRASHQQRKVHSGRFLEEESQVTVSSHCKQPLYPKATCVVVLSLIGLMVCVSIVCCSSRADRSSKPYEALHVIACDSVMKYDST